MTHHKEATGRAPKAPEAMINDIGRSLEDVMGERVADEVTFQKESIEVCTSPHGPYASIAREKRDKALKLQAARKGSTLPQSDDLSDTAK